MPLDPSMQYSQSGEQLTEQFESCSLTAYRDVRGIWTIGWGHVSPAVHAGMTMTQAQADAQLLADVRTAVSCVNKSVNVALTQSEFDSLTDFVFNIGCEAFESSTMLELLNQGAYQLAAAQFARWDYAGGKVVAGLLRRREAETAEFEEA
jgi:lysozyme